MFWLRILLLIVVVLRFSALWGVLRPQFRGATQRVGDDTIRWRVKRRDKGRSIESIAIAVDIADAFRFLLRAETALDRICKTVGLSREWQTSDPEFDRSIYVISDDQRLLEWLTVDSELRTIVRELIEEFAAEIHCAHGQLWVQFAQNRPDEAERADEFVVAEFAPQVLPRVKKLSARIHAISNEPWEHRRDPIWRRRQWVIGLCAVLGVGGVLALFWSEGAGLPHQLVLDAINRLSGWAAVVAAAVLLILLFGLIRRSAYTHLILIEIVLVGIPGAWLVTHASLTRANQQLDVATPTLHVVRITDAVIKTGRRNSKTYFVTVDAWPDPRAPRKLKVTRALFDSVHEGACVQVTWYPGRFGDPWVSQWRVLGRDCLAW